MSKPLPDAMIEATRLTQAGRLGEATALIQTLLKGVWPRGETKADHNNGAAHIIDLVAEDITTRETPRAKFPHRIDEQPAPSAVSVPSVGTFSAKAFSNEAGSRTYKLYVPSGYKGQPRPLIVMLHGCSQSPDDFAAGTRMNFAAEEHGCFVVYPEQSGSANASKCWNWFKSGDQQRGKGEPALIAGLTQQIMADYAIDARRVYIAGLSAGGAIAAVIAEAYPDIYAAVGVHSGLACGVATDMSSAFTAMQGRHRAPAVRTTSTIGNGRPVPTIVFHGDRDSTVHPRNGAEVVAQASGDTTLKAITEQGSVADGHAYTRTVQRDAGGRSMIEDWVVHGSGHAWSGGNPAGSFTDPKGPDATKAMLRFFLEHPRRG